MNFPLLRVFSRSFQSSRLSIVRTSSPRPKLPKEQLKFGALMSDHMLEVDWQKSSGWSNPRILPYGPLQLDPSVSALHYGLQCFEGMKAYIDSNQEIRLFRPDMNAKRLNNSAHRLLLPQFDESEFLECLKNLVKVDRDWIPSGFGYSLYLRPTLIATHPFLGVQPPLSAKLFVISSPVGPYYPEGFNPIKLFADTQHVRAWPGGAG